MTCGTEAALFAVQTLLQLLEDEDQRFALAILLLKDGRYVNNIIGGTDSAHIRGVFKK